LSLWKIGLRRSILLRAIGLPFNYEAILPHGACYVNPIIPTNSLRGLTGNFETLNRENSRHNREYDPGTKEMRK
jgi:hypothetical protein